jgi:tricorn protease
MVPSPWGAYQPEPYLDKRTQIYQLALVEGLRSPFTPDDELHQAQDEEDAKKPEDAEANEAEPADEPAEVTAGSKEAESVEAPEVQIDLDGIQERLRLLPIPPGNYRSLEVSGDALFWSSTSTDRKTTDLVAAKITNELDDEGHVARETVVPEIDSYRISGDRKRLLVRKGKAFHVLDAKPKQAKLDKTAIDLSRWRMSVVPREEWRQMFDEAWRLERDYFYDLGMHGVDWEAMRAKYRPLVDRVTNRDELADLLAQMVSELSALHIFVYGGDQRSGRDDVQLASLGATLERDERAGGYRVSHVYRSDPDQPDRAAPLAHPDVNVGKGDLIEMVNGVATLSVADLRLLLRDQAGRQVRLRVKPAGGGARREVIVQPISMREARDLRYHEWEYTRRIAVEEKGEGEIGYVHLRAMGGGNFTEWARGFYPVFHRKGLIVDVRHNRGGNIDSWILNRLLRRIWFYWSQRMGRAPIWNMQYAFGGHVVVLCNERTASDGEAFTEGIRRLGIGTILGTRTWGGEIWLSSNNFLVDRGIATAAEYGVFSPDGEWLIEGHGVEPDIVVDNLPHETFHGRDAQLEAAIEFLQRKIDEEPVELPPVPPHPDHSYP